MGAVVDPGTSGVGEQAHAPQSKVPYLLLEGATLLSGIGNAIASVALPWLVLERTGNAAAAGLVGAATGIPMVLSGLFIGTVVDALGRRRSALISDVLSCLAVLAIPLVDETVGLTVPWLVALAALGAFFDPAGWTARETLLPEAARRAGLQLERVNGVHEAVWGFAFLAGPGIAGLSIAFIGAVGTLWLATAGFAVSVVLVGCIRLADVSHVHFSPRAMWAGTREGLSFVWHERLLRNMGLLSALIVGVYLPVEAVMLPAHFQSVGAPERLGLLLAAMSAGGIVGALAYGAWGYRWSRRWTFLGAYISCAALMLALGALPAYAVMVVLAALVGFTYGPADPLFNLAMQQKTPEQLRGRAYGVLTSLQYSSGPIAMVLAGVLVEKYGVRTAMMSTTGVLLAILLLATRMRSLAALDDEDMSGDRPITASTATSQG